MRQTFKQLFPNNKKLHELMDSPQYAYSEELMDIRYEESLEAEELASIAGVTLDEYIQLEYGDSTIPVEVYKTVLHKINVTIEATKATDT